MKSSLSIRTRIALSAMALVLVVVAVISGLAYREVRQTAIDATNDHLESVSRQLGDLLGAAASQTAVAAHAAASDSTLDRFLNERGADASHAALGTLMAIANQRSAKFAVELWDLDGRRLLTTRDTMEALPTRDARDAIALLGTESAGVGEISRSRGNKLGYVVIARVGAPGRSSGFLVERGAMATPSASAQLRQLLGSGAALFVGNARGNVWTDLADIAAAPAIPRIGTREYDRAGTGVVLASIRAIPNTPWLVAVESSRSLALASAHALLRRLALATLVLLILSTAGAWSMSAQLAQPIVRLMSKAAGLGADRSSSARERRDEVGAIDVAFDAMADTVTQTRATLEHAVAELRDTELRYRMLFDASPQAMWVYDLETWRFLAVNDAAVKRYGYSREEFVTMTILEIRPPEDVPALRANLDELGPDGKIESRVWRHRVKGGRDIEVEISSRPLTVDGRSARLVIANDLTKRRRAEESLRSTQERLERLLGSSGAVLYELRLGVAEPKLVWVSANISTILGYELSEVYDPAWWSNGVHPDDRSRMQESAEVKDQLDVANEYRFRHKDGRYRWLREDHRFIRGRAGEATKVVGVWVDITQQRELEVQFRQSQKMDAIGRLAGGVAHDFNNLLTVILAESQFISGEGELSLDQRESLTQIRKAGDRAALLTRQLLTFSRLQVVDATALDLNDVAEEIEKMIRRLIGEDIDFHLALNDVPVIAVADRGQLEQLIVNLAVNARDAMPDGGMLTIETGIAKLDQAYADAHPDVTPGTHAVVSVSDSGIGMSDSVKAHIFEPFFTTKEKGKGTGLGLATCYAIAKQFHGHLAVYSEPGLGTTVRLYLPCSEPDAQDICIPRSPIQSGVETVLVVEDEEPVRRITARSLRALGYTVLEAANGADALRMLADTDGGVQLLMSDVVMPEMGGRVVAERAREIEPGIAVLFVSGYSDDVILRHRLVGGDIVLLQKPFTIDALAEKVRQAIDGRRTNLQPVGICA